MKRNVLGKGLDALLPETTFPQGLNHIDLDRIQPNRLQPRLHLEAESLAQLADSIAENGVLQPIIVRRRQDTDSFELVAGERRWRAAQQAGLPSIPALIQDLSDEKTLEVALVENVQRQELSAIEEAHAYSILIENFQLSQDEVARRVGKSRSAVANTLRLLKLPTSLQEQILDGSLSMGHARALLPLPEDQQRLLAAEVKRKGLSVRQTERAVKRLGRSSKQTQAQRPDPNLTAAEQRLEERFQTRVRILKNGSRGGKLILHFHNDEELDRLFESLMAC